MWVCNYKIISNIHHLSVRRNIYPFNPFLFSHYLFHNFLVLFDGQLNTSLSVQWWVCATLTGCGVSPKTLHFLLCRHDNHFDHIISALCFPSNWQSIILCWETVNIYISTITVLRPFSNNESRSDKNYNMQVKGV